MLRESDKCSTCFEICLPGKSWDGLILIKLRNLVYKFIYVYIFKLVIVVLLFMVVVIRLGIAVFLRNLKP